MTPRVRAPAACGRFRASDTRTRGWRSDTEAPSCRAPSPARALGPERDVDRDDQRHVVDRARVADHAGRDQQRGGSEVERRVRGDGWIEAVRAQSQRAEGETVSREHREKQKSGAEVK